MYYIKENHLLGLKYLNIMTEHYRIDFGDFNIDIAILTDDISPGITRKDLIRAELRSALKTHHYMSATSGYTIEDIHDIYGIDPSDSWDNIVSTIWDFDQPKYKAKSIKKLPSCEGCRYNAPGQKDHMQIGGCLYDPDNNNTE